MKTLMVIIAMMQWNFPVAQGSCCKFHAGTAEVLKVAGLMMQRRCAPDFGPHEEYQCETCGALDSEVHRRCEYCKKSSQASLSSIPEEEVAS
eukprot:CAMPEP_0204553824 /NCGR_PEP_ID=MMETSP0661-20131031/27641_1 /ASSEMBLY_ACC=CAM_ASM_000606 /TAXON_ID=109239 /ORGANISM="Alexandrium margalefi, Strain AMGDE01CS-322" /LENGTH=91 /DNA_ID=CAMNT_0051560871 /DNA_START=1 /DNA_END=273 /DNA_ORIENTATION=+